MQHDHQGQVCCSNTFGARTACGRWTSFAGSDGMESNWIKLQEGLSCRHKSSLPLLHAGARSRQGCCHEGVPAELPSAVSSWYSCSTFAMSFTGHHATLDQVHWCWQSWELGRRDQRVDQPSGGFAVLFVHNLAIFHILSFVLLGTVGIDVCSTSCVHRALFAFGSLAGVACLRPRPGKASKPQSGK